MIRPWDATSRKYQEAQEQHNDGSLRKSGAFHDRLRLVWEAKGALFSSMALFSTRDPGAGVDNCAYARRYGGDEMMVGLQAEHICGVNALSTIMPSPIWAVWKPI